ncbi:MAG: HD-GYP domain-containing protein [Candidatus Eremiobacteraeota bacterium]|nr:HD-GYP domain-containing protein [Candidatus Eremiobacteraeota bacterium]MBC5803916.1 HD-GYP domain-containing protein [Candidatus Eremiobacteraeota bacterium]MBC5822423.1 HD-GYP domain-containing protein [Candidatus Eremiobacteraeota bacterium]
MSAAAISRDRGNRLASYLEVRRAELVSRIVGSPALERPGDPAISAFASAFLDRFTQEIEVGDRDVVAVWLDGEAQSDGHAEAARIITIACGAIASCYARDYGFCDEVLAYLTVRSSELEKRLRLDRAHAAPLVDVANLVSKDEVVAALLAALEARDAATCEHSRAVGMWCGRIAKMVGLPPERQRIAVLAGILHDVGKLATPSEILLKPGPLEPHEWETMRDHSRVGAQMLERIPSLGELTPIVRAHHERIDGRGYPDGEVGDRIPRLARIVAVADAFHAMISRRPYRAAMTLTAALDELRAGSGTQWDSALVDAMLEIVQPARTERHAAALKIAR